MDGSETVLGVKLLVLGFRVFSSDFPNALFIEWEISPAGAYREKSGCDQIESAELGH